MPDPHDPQPAEPAVDTPQPVEDNGSVRQTTYKEPGSREQTPATEATQAELRAINATTVVMDRSGSEQITAERVTMNRSGARSLDTKSAQLDQSGVVALGSDSTVLLQSSALQIIADEVRMSRSAAIFVTAEHATLEDSRVIVFAGTTDGDVHAVITARGAAVLGAAAGLVLTLLLVLLGVRSGSRD